MTSALIIDDEFDICYLLKNILKTKNLDVSYENSLTDGAAALQTKHPQILFLDNHLPDGLGVDYIKQFKATNPGIKVVLLTAFDNYTDRMMALVNGADTFISKPFTKDTISKTVDQLVQN
jgi:two-component system OmpR family response regulator